MGDPCVTNIKTKKTSLQHEWVTTFNSTATKVFRHNVPPVSALNINNRSCQ